MSPCPHCNQHGFTQASKWAATDLSPAACSICGELAFIPAYRRSGILVASMEQVSRRSLETHFTAIFDGNTPKSEALRQIAAANPERGVVFFGDSIGDYEAAQKAEVAFVAVACERDNFAKMQIVKIRDFANQMVLEGAMLEAFSRRGLTGRST